jgi:type VI secretion system secreted protein Hcp
MSGYLKIQGIDGDVTAKGLEKCIKIQSCNFDVARKMNTQPGSVTNREGTKPSVSEVTISKLIDKTTPALLKEAAVGSVIPSVEIKFVNTGADLSEYHSVTLSDVLISGYSFDYDTKKPGSEEKGEAAHDHESLPMEKITFNFMKIENKFTPYDENNKPGSPCATGYNLKTAQAT